MVVVEEPDAGAHGFKRGSHAVTFTAVIPAKGGIH
jgi:hypothetical protein